MNCRINIPSTRATFLRKYIICHCKWGSECFWAAWTKSIILHDTCNGYLTLLPHPICCGISYINTGTPTPPIVERSITEQIQAASFGSHWSKAASCRALLVVRRSLMILCIREVRVRAPAGRGRIPNP